MHFTIEQQDAMTIFRLKEARLDSANASALKAEFLILAQPDVETLIVDLSEVTYVDSAGLSALLLAERQQSSHGGEVRLAGANQSVQSLLRLTQLDRVFPMYSTLQEAMTAEPVLDIDGGELPQGSSPNADGTSRGDATKAGGAKSSLLAVGAGLGAAGLAAILMGESDDPDATLDLDDDEFEDDEFDDDDFDDDDDDDFDDEEEPAEEVKEETAEADAVDEDAIEEELDDDLDDLDDFDDDDDDDFEEEDDLL